MVLSVHRLVVNLYCGKTADSIEIPYEVVDRVDGVLDGSQDASRKMTDLEGKWGGTMRRIVKVRH